MIYTITFSPSIDYFIFNEKPLDINDTNRFDNYNLFPGGKGINASIILNKLNEKNKAIIFTGGITKNLFLDLLSGEKLDVINFNSKSNIRINVKYIGLKNNFELNGPRLVIEDSEFLNLKKLLKQLNENDVVMLMGITNDQYLSELVDIFYERNIKFILDVDSKKIIDLVKFHPFVIKPNRLELENIFNEKVSTISDIKNKMLILKQKGAINVIVSDGKNGNFLLDKDNNFFQIKILPLSQKIVSAIGCGDTLISSFSLFLLQNKSSIEAIKNATALSIGSACSLHLANKEDIDRFINNVQVEKI